MKYVEIIRKMLSSGVRKLTSDRNGTLTEYNIKNVYIENDKIVFIYENGTKEEFNVEDAI